MIITLLWVLQPSMITRLMLEKGADNYNEAMIKASRIGHEAIVRQMLSRDANNYNVVLTIAARRGHESSRCCQL